MGLGHKPEWSIRPHSGVVAAQWDWGISLHCHCAGLYEVIVCPLGLARIARVLKLKQTPIIELL